MVAWVKCNFAKVTIAPYLDQSQLIFIINVVLIGDYFIAADRADMVRTYKRKTLPPSYSKEDLKTVMESVKSGRMTIYRAAKLYKIPKATLFKHVKGSRGVKSQMLGRPTALLFHEEKKIADCLKLMEKRGYGLSKKEILEMIGRYVNENNIPTPFRGGVPGNEFFSRFKRTHNLSLKKPQSVEVTSGEVSERMKETE
jgi:hypothetical protein